MANYTKTSGVTVIALVAVTNPSYVQSNEIPIDSTISISLGLFVGRVAATADTNPATYYVERNMNATGDEGWESMLSFKPVAATAATEALDAIAAAGQKVITVASTTGFVAGDQVYVEDTVTIGNGEFHTVDSISAGVSITLRDNLVTAKPASAVIWGAADWFPVTNLDLSSVKRLRVTYDNRGATAVTTHIKVPATTCDSIG